MRHLIAFLGLFLVLFACTPRLAPAPAAQPALQTVEVRKEIDVRFHGDTAFTGTERQSIRAACDEWRQFSADRVRFDVAWDLDFGDLEALRAHIHDPALVRVTSDYPIVERFEDEMGLTGKGRIVGVTLHLHAPAVYFVVDRARDLRTVALHEFGHVGGLPDVEAVGNIMTGRDPVGAPVVPHFTPSDLALCQKALLCP